MKGVIHRLASKQEQTLQDKSGVRFRVDIGDVDEVLSSKDVKLLKQVGTTEDGYLRPFQLNTSFLRLHLHSKIATWKLGDLANLVASVEVCKKSVAMSYA